MGFVMSVRAAPEQTPSPPPSSPSSPSPSPSQSRRAPNVTTACEALVAHGIPCKSYDCGSDDGLPVVLVPGFLGADSHWNVARLRARYRGACFLTTAPGPLSSHHDRACEVFYSLKGGVVDYGAEHARRCGHARFGRDEGAGSYPEWDEAHPIDVVGHSVGGVTVRVLQQLLADGAFPAHKTSSGWIRSLTTLSSPHNGDPLVYALGARQQSLPPLPPLLPLPPTRGPTGAAAAAAAAAAPRPLPPPVRSAARRRFAWLRFSCDAETARAPDGYILVDSSCPDGYSLVDSSCPDGGLGAQLGACAGGGGACGCGISSFDGGDGFPGRGPQQTCPDGGECDVCPPDACSNSGWFGGGGFGSFGGGGVGPVRPFSAGHLLTVMMHVLAWLDSSALRSIVDVRLDHWWLSRREHGVGAWQRLLAALLWQRSVGQSDDNAAFEVRPSTALTWFSLITFDDL